MDPTESKPAGWYPSSRTPGMERYWNGDFWTGDYRPDSSLQGQFGIAEHSQEPPVSEFNPDASDAGTASNPPKDVWSALDSEHHKDGDLFITPGIQTEYSMPTGAPAQAPQQPYAYGPAPVNYNFQTNQGQGLSIAALILAFFAPLVGAILGHVAFSKAKKVNAPRGVSLAAIIVGWINCAFSLLFFVVPLVFSLALSAVDYPSYESSYDDDVVYDYILSTTTEDILTERYPEYDWWYVSCPDDIAAEVGSSTSTCDVVLYPTKESSDSEKFTSTVTFVGGDSLYPQLEVTLDREPTPLESSLR